MGEPSRKLPNRAHVKMLAEASGSLYHIPSQSHFFFKGKRMEEKNDKF